LEVNVDTLWEAPFRAVQRESDPEKLLEKLHETEAAMFARWQELGTSPDTNAEREAMRRATDVLLKIKTEKLKWPG
jgi:hypothetical protein